jgi:hypothetical protein
MSSKNWTFKKLLLGLIILVFLGISTEVLSSISINWKKTFFIQNLSSTAIAYSQEGFLLCVPEEGEPNNGYKLIKTDKKGNLIWSKPFLDPDWEYKITSIVSTSDNSYVLCGESSSEITAHQRVLYICKIDSEGTEEWHKIYGASYGECIGCDIIARSDPDPFRGGYFAIGNCGNASENYPNIYLVRLFPNGGAFFNKELERKEGIWVEALCYSENQHIITGTIYREPDEQKAIWVSKLNHLGNIVWEKTIDGSDSYIASDIEVTQSGAFILVGSIQSRRVGCSSFIAIKLDSDGRDVWRRIYDTNSFDTCNSVIATSDGGYLLVGTSGGNIKIIKTDSKGNQLRQCIFRSVFSREEGYWVFEVDSGRYVIGGLSRFLHLFSSLTLFELN